MIDSNRRGYLLNDGGYGVPMEQALTTDQCIRMQRFFTYYNRCKPGQVSRLIKGYREYLSGHRGSENVR
jgi:hypothetical protein